MVFERFTMASGGTPFARASIGKEIRKETQG
jgi:hypothetical protein